MSEEKNDYAFYSEALHSSYLFYTMEVDKLSKENEQLKAQLEVFLRLSDIKVAVKLQREKNMLVEALKTISKMDITEDYYSIDEQPCIVAINTLEELEGWNEQ